MKPSRRMEKFIGDRTGRWGVFEVSGDETHVAPSTSDGDTHHILIRLTCFCMPERDSGEVGFVLHREAS